MSVLSEILASRSTASAGYDGKTRVLSSLWTGLNPQLLATIYPVGRDGMPQSGPVVMSPPTDSNIEITANWQSPFEHSGAEVKAPTIMALLQTGAAGTYTQAFGEFGTAARKAIDAKLPGLGNLLDSLFGSAKTDGIEASNKIAEAQGRSGMTKLNSTQVFTGAAPIKIPMTLHFRAFKDPAREVEAPLAQLAQWTLAAELSKFGSALAAAKNAADGQGVVKALLPSVAPQMVGFRFGGYTFAPMVIESMSHPITVPRTAGGAMLHVAVSLTLCSLTALDSNDWTRARSGHPTQLFNN